MPKYFTLGSYSISILHYSLYHWDEREIVFLRVIRAYENWLAAYYGYEEDNRRMHDIWRRRIEKDPDYIIKFGQEHRKNFKNLNEYLDKILGQVAFADRRKILSIFNSYWELLFLSQPIGDINLNIDKIYLELLTRDFEKFLNKKGQSDKFTEYLIDLTTPWQKLSTMREEADFLKIVWRVKRAEVNETAGLLKTHLRKYEWLPCWYDNAPWDLTYLKDRLNKELKTPDIENRLRRAKNFPAKTKARAQRIIKKLNIKGKLLRDLAGLRAFTYIRTEVDLNTGYVTHKARPIYLRLTELLSLNFEQLKFLTPDEIRLSLRNKLTTSKLLGLIKSRQNFAVQIFNRGQQKILVGKKARLLIKSVTAGLASGHQNVKIKGVYKLRGIGASLGSGIARGQARVIGSISELKTMREGEILVVPSTSVDYVAAMKKAAAIVTEVGGLTCHAAIVSRELNKPCLVNTLSSTRVFKTGDWLEVDAKKGTVKKLSNK